MKKTQFSLANSDFIDVYHQGAHLSSWQCNGKEQLFLSKQALLAEGVAIRGGVPVIFPQFGVIGSGKKHGFARNVLWQLDETSEHNGLRFTLSNNTAIEKIWPYPFAAQFDVIIDKNTLTMCLTIKNTGDTDFDFTAALHTYLAVDHIEQCRLHGLQHCAYWDNGTPFEQRQAAQNETLEIHEAIDRIYFDTANKLVLTEQQQTREITSRGFSDTVVWNPWQEGAAAFNDMADNEYLTMLCIESAAINTPVQLAPEAIWTGEQIITVK